MGELAQTPEAKARQAKVSFSTNIPGFAEHLKQAGWRETPPDEQAQRLEDAMKAAQEDRDARLREYGEALDKAAHAYGYAAGFKAGYNAYLEHVERMARGARVE